MHPLKKTNHEMKIKSFDVAAQCGPSLPLLNGVGTDSLHTCLHPPHLTLQTLSVPSPLKLSAHWSSRTTFTACLVTTWPSKRIFSFDDSWTCFASPKPHVLPVPGLSSNLPGTHPSMRWHILQTHCYFLDHLPMVCIYYASPGGIFASHVDSDKSLKGSFSRRMLQQSWVSLSFSPLTLYNFHLAYIPCCLVTTFVSY